MRIRQFASQSAARPRTAPGPMVQIKNRNGSITFHTGYNLIALHRFGRFTGREDFKRNIESGFVFYRTHFFEDGCLPKYYHDRLYPIDIHSIAQSIITLTELKEYHSGNLDLARSVCGWALENMKDRSRIFLLSEEKILHEQDFLYAVVAGMDAARPCDSARRL